MFREGMGLIYSDGYYKAATLGESGGAFPRHANTQFLGQFGDPRIPNILKIHNDFARGLQQGRWGDSDYMAYERRDNRDKFGNVRNGTASEEITMVAMFNDNTKNLRGISDIQLIEGPQETLNSLNAEEVRHAQAAIPVLMLDMWEHAFYLDYLNVKGDYVKAFWSIVSWGDVQTRFEAARKQTKGLLLG
jgi:hypothetical protein